MLPFLNKKGYVGIMAQSNKKISSILKASILLDLNAEGYSKIAESHGISRTVIYGWIKELQADKAQRINDINSSPKNNFVEVALVDNQNCQSSNLQKASLIFNDFSLIIEGNISAVRLLKILKNLEELC